MKSLDLTQTLASMLIARDWKIVLAESCTGGLVCATLTDLAGSSKWFERGFITYSNEAKTECLGVAGELIESFGAVSEEVALAMASGALKASGANVAIAITGIAGPSGGSAEKPVGTVCFGWALQNSSTETRVICKTMHFAGDRSTVREEAKDYALAELIALLRN
jgi:nicotinamide-nucleotide amidase